MNSSPVTRLLAGSDGPAGWGTAPSAAADLAFGLALAALVVLALLAVIA